MHCELSNWIHLWWSGWRIIVFKSICFNIKEAWIYFYEIFINSSTYTCDICMRLSRGICICVHHPLHTYTFTHVSIHMLLFPSFLLLVRTPFEPPAVSPTLSHSLSLSLFFFPTLFSFLFVLSPLLPFVDLALPLLVFIPLPAPPVYSCLFSEPYSHSENIACTLMCG